MSGSRGRVSSLRRFEDGAALEEDFFFFFLVADVVTDLGRLETLVGTMDPEFLERLVRFLEAGMVD